MQENVIYTTFNTSAAGVDNAESTSAPLEDNSEVEDTSEVEESSEVYTESVYVDYTEQLTAIQSSLTDTNTRLELNITLLFITLAILVSVVLFRIFNWFWKDL